MCNANVAPVKVNCVEPYNYTSGVCVSVCMCIHIFMYVTASK